MHGGMFDLTNEPIDQPAKELKKAILPFESGVLVHITLRRFAFFVSRRQVGPGVEQDLFDGRTDRRRVAVFVPHHMVQGRFAGFIFRVHVRSRLYRDLISGV